jgi:hypothetical protein
MNFHTRKTLEAIEQKIQEMFQINVDDIPGGPIHRFHQDPKKVKSILKNLLALPHQEDFEFEDVFFRTDINTAWDEPGQIAAYVVNWGNVTESQKFEQALNIRLKELNDANLELLMRNWQIELEEIELKYFHAE